MEMIRINETPTRTSRNFNINNIAINSDEINREFENFSNVTISCDCQKIETTISTFDKKQNKNENIGHILEYGLSEDLTYNVVSKKNVQIDIKAQNLKPQTVYLNFEFDKNNKTLVDVINVEACENAKLNLVIKYSAKENVINTFQNEILKVKANKNAYINICYINLMEDSAMRLSCIQNEVLNAAKVSYSIIEFGANKITSNFNSCLKEESSNVDVKTIYLGNKNQVLDFNYIANQYGKNSTYNLDVVGALKDKAEKHFKGDIDFKKGAKKAKGNENESCIVLSKNAHSISLPMLLCSEEDVEGNHSSSAGKIDDKELFYIMSRGISYTDSLKLVLRARFNKVIDRIKDESLQNEIILKIDEKLN